MTGADDYRGLGWEHGSLAVQRLGAMLAPITFLLADGRQVSPMQVAPWAYEPASEDLPGVLRRLRGEWPCVPFGYSAAGEGFAPEWAGLMSPADSDEEVHGHSANHFWQWSCCSSSCLALSLDYPAASPIARVERNVTPDSAQPAVDIEFRIHVRRACRLPIGLHPTFHLPRANGLATIEPAHFDHGRTYPGTIASRSPLFAIDRTFAALDAVPARDGRLIDASRVPYGVDTEELLQLNGIDGEVALANHAEGYRIRLSWQKAHFPSLLLWFSNRGRTAPPWNGRHLALGMEPVCSPFGLGPATAAGDNPIARSGTPTARDFAGGEVFATHYRIAAEPL